MKTKRILIAILIVVVILCVLAITLSKQSSTDKEAMPTTNIPGGAPEIQYTTYKSSEYGFEFSYPRSWGDIEIFPGNKTCPEEGTYRTPDTLSIFDKEFGFKEIDLESTESMIRYGVRVYNINPNKTNNCNDEVLRKLAKKEITGEEFSSFRLTPAAIPGFYGVHNESASRLDTEGREQYTLFVKKSETSVLIIQPYMSFIPYADSPEWKEIDSTYPMDILSYIRQGKTAGEIRSFLAEFRKMAQSLRMNAQ